MFKIDEMNSGGNNVDLQLEAKNIVLEEMEKQGLISRMRAQIKNSVLKVLEKQKQNIKNNLEFDYMTPLHRMNKSKEVLLAYHVIKEFMQFYELEYTMPIFENETNIRENIKRDTLINELSLNSGNIMSHQSEPKPVLIQLITNYLQEMQTKKHMENASQKLDDSYGVKNHLYQNIDVNFTNNSENKSDSGSTNFTPSIGKKQLTPISFVNKSVEIKESNSPSNKESSGSKDNESLKFNTANINDFYSQSNTDAFNNNKFGTGSSLNSYENKNIIKENISNANSKNENPPNTDADFKFQFNSAEYVTNTKYDDEFNEVILEEINEKNILSNKKDDENEKSLTLNSGNNFGTSMGYDSSVTNYKLEDFDHIEEVEKPY
jgi:hypothetical protein